jgi:NAD(P)-dependent dehydrogenase (short-subunit alcohol dehydrogenase family)
MSGRTVLIVGATSGVGKASARQLAADPQERKQSTPRRQHGLRRRRSAGAVPNGPDEAALPRVVNVNSAGHQSSLAGHRDPELDFDDLHSRRDYDPFLAYSRSKLANMLFTYELVRRYGNELAVAALHPGVARTDLGRYFPRIRVAAAQAFAISAKRSARSVVALATGALPENGRYFDEHVPRRSSPPSYDADVAARLWSLTEELCGPFEARGDDHHTALQEHRRSAPS